MAWFMAVVVRGSHVEGVLDESRLGDLLYRLIEAPNAEAAHARALQLGRTLSDSFTDSDGTSVSLEFLGLADLAEISARELVDGVEVYSQMLPQAPSDQVALREQLTVFEEAVPLEAFKRNYEPIG